MITVGLGVLLCTGCSRESAEARARAAAEKVKESMPDVEAKALAQRLTPERVKHAQAALTAAQEYQGEIDGQLDAVTVNAIEAFQRAHGLKGDGMLNDKTEKALNEVLAESKGTKG